MDGDSEKSGIFKIADDFVGAVFRTCENERAADRIFLQRHRQKRLLVAGANESGELLDPFCGRRDGSDGDANRIVLIIRRKRGDRFRHRRGEKHGLTRFRHQRHDRTQSMNEAEVEHLIGLIENGDFNAVQHDRLAVDQIDKAAGRCDENVDAAMQVANLPVDRHAAEDSRHRYLDEPSIGGE